MVAVPTAIRRAMLCLIEYPESLSKVMARWRAHAAAISIEISSADSCTLRSERFYQDSITFEESGNSHI